MKKNATYILSALLFISVFFNLYQHRQYDLMTDNLQLLKNEIDTFSFKNELLINTISRLLTEENELLDLTDDGLQHIMPDTVLQKMRSLHQSIRKSSDSILRMNELFRRFKNMLGAAESKQNQFKLNADEMREKLMLQSAELELMKTELDLYKKQINQLNQKTAEIHITLENGIKLRYIGETENKRPEGLGVGFYNSGGYYIGMWKDGKRHGSGEYHWKNGDKYIGEYVNDKRNGHGEYVYSNGYKYKGNWRDDLREGYGELIDDEGKVLVKGIWKNDKLTKKQ